MAAATGGDGDDVKALRRWRFALTVMVLLLVLSLATVGVYLWSQRLAIPPRPQPSQKLLDDTQLAREGALPEVKNEWREDATKRHHTIRSLFSDDFSDLQFLKPLLKDKRIVQLGESSHGVAEYSWLKVRLAKFLHREMGFDVLAFESSLPECEYANRQIDVMTSGQLINTCLFAVWNTHEVLPIFDYAKQQRKMGATLTISGFDIQGSGSGWPDVKRLFTDALAAVDQDQARAAGALEEHFWAWFKRAKYEEGYETLAANYEALTLKLQAALASEKAMDAARRQELLLAWQTAKSRIAYIQNLAVSKSNPGKSYEIRDKAMAETLDFLLDQRYPGRKFLVWAHNLHVGVNFPTRQNYKSMATYLAERRKRDMYTIGFFMGRGVQAERAAPPKLARFDAQAENSLESVMASAGRKMSFVDFSQVKPAPSNEWIFSPIPARDWGVKPIELVVSQVFDGLIYIDTVTPPQYLK
jgi:erythromycin esterase